jgi:hypothetical protein
MNLEEARKALRLKSTTTRQLSNRIYSRFSMSEIKYKIVKKVGVTSTPSVLRTSPPNTTTKIQDVYWTVGSSYLGEDAPWEPSVPWAFVQLIITRAIRLPIRGALPLQGAGATGMRREGGRG